MFVLLLRFWNDSLTSSIFDPHESAGTIQGFGPQRGWICCRCCGRSAFGWNFGDRNWWDDAEDVEDVCQRKWWHTKHINWSAQSTVWDSCLSWGMCQCTLGFNTITNPETSLLKPSIFSTLVKDQHPLFFKVIPPNYKVSFHGFSTQNPSVTQWT